MWRSDNLFSKNTISSDMLPSDTISIDTYPSDITFNDICPSDIFPIPVGSTLVSFRAMVQDTSISPEFYQALDGSLCQRTVLWVVSVPGESPWCPSSQSIPCLHTPLRPHKYPIPGAHHTGLQVKVRRSKISNGSH